MATSTQTVRRTPALLEGKYAVIFGAGGSIGAAIAKEFAAQGATVYLSGRTASKLEAIASDVSAIGSRAEIAKLDALDEAAVSAYIDDIVRRAGQIDVAFNAIGLPAAAFGSGTPALELTVEQFMAPLLSIVRPQFVTARAVGRQMSRQKNGVIMFVTGSPAHPHIEGATAIGAAMAATENFASHLALELGPLGVRVACLRSSAMPDSQVIMDTMQGLVTAMNLTKDQANEMLASHTMLRISPSTADTARVAAFLASDQARTITGTVVMSQIR